MGIFKLNYDYLEGNCDICDSGRIEEILEVFVRYFNIRF